MCGSNNEVNLVPTVLKHVKANVLKPQKIVKNPNNGLLLRIHSKRRINFNDPLKIKPPKLQARSPRNENQ